MAFYQLYNTPKKQFTKYLLKALDGKESVSISSISFIRLFHSYMFGINSIPTPLLLNSLSLVLDNLPEQLSFICFFFSGFITVTCKWAFYA